MSALVVAELLPGAFRGGHRAAATAGLAAGAGIMLALGAALGV